MSDSGKVSAVSRQSVGFLQSLGLTRDLGPDGASPYTLTLVLADALPPAQLLTLRFIGVIGLEIGALDGLLRWFVETREVRDHQLEGVRYRVVESEQDALKLWCADVTRAVVPCALGGT